MSLPLLWELQLLQDIFRAVNLSGYPNPMPCFYHQWSRVWRQGLEMHCWSFRGRKQERLYPHLPQEPQNTLLCKMQLPLMEVTAESFLALLFSVGSAVGCYNTPYREEQRREHLVFYLSC